MHRISNWIHSKLSWRCLPLLNHPQSKEKMVIPMQSVSLPCFLLLNSHPTTTLKVGSQRTKTWLGASQGQEHILRKKKVLQLKVQYWISIQKHRNESKNESIKVQETILSGSKRHLSLPVTRYIFLLPWSTGHTGVDLKGEN